MKGYIKRPIRTKRKTSPWFHKGRRFNKLTIREISIKRSEWLKNYFEIIKTHERLIREDD